MSSLVIRTSCCTKSNGYVPEAFHEPYCDDLLKVCTHTYAHAHAHAYAHACTHAHTSWMMCCKVVWAVSVAFADEVTPIALAS